MSLCAAMDLRTCRASCSGRPMLCSRPRAVRPTRATASVGSGASPTSIRSNNNLRIQPASGAGSTPSNPCSSSQQLQQQPLSTTAQLPAYLLAALPVLLMLLPAEACQAASGVPLHDIADLDAPTALLIENILRPLFNIFTLLYIVRIPMTWYPNLDIKTLPWALFCAPTEPFLSVARRIVPLVGGVDVTPIVLVAIISFFNEILLGPQGILELIQQEVPVPM